MTNARCGEKHSNNARGTLVNDSAQNSPLEVGSGRVSFLVDVITSAFILGVPDVLA